MLEVQKVSFMMDDLGCIWIRIPEDQDALAVFRDVVKQRKQTLSEFAEQFYPLTVDCMAEIYEKEPSSSLLLLAERRGSVGRGVLLMWIYEKKAPIPCEDHKTCPKTAQLIISQYGGPDGELSASCGIFPSVIPCPLNP